MGQAAIGHAGRRIDHAAHRRDARSDRAGGGPFRRVLEGTDVGNVGSGRADETLVFGVDEADRPVEADARAGAGEVRSEEHTSELQSLMRISYAVFCLKKKTHRVHNEVYNMYKANKQH